MKSWNTKGALTNPYDITRYSLWPEGVTKAVFHSSPSCIRMRLYKLRRSNLVMFECRWDERKRITELDCDFVECPVIDTRAQASVVLGHEERAWSSRVRWRANVTLLKSLFDILLHGLLFREGKWKVLNRTLTQPATDLWHSPMASAEVTGRLSSGRRRR